MCSEEQSTICEVKEKSILSLYWRGNNEKDWVNIILIWTKPCIISSSQHYGKTEEDGDEGTDVLRNIVWWSAKTVGQKERARGEVDRRSMLEEGKIARRTAVLYVCIGSGGVKPIPSPPQLSSGREKKGRYETEEDNGEQTNESVRYHEQSYTNEAYLLQASAVTAERRGVQ